MFAAHVAKERKKYEAAPMEKFIASKISNSISVGPSLVYRWRWIQDLRKGGDRFISERKNPDL